MRPYADIKISPEPEQPPHPPIWVGGNCRRGVASSCALWQGLASNQPEPGMAEAVCITRLQHFADAEGKPMPALCPRVRCRLTEAPLPEGERTLGEGTLDQVRRDLELLQELGAPYVLLDTKRNSPTALLSQHHEESWRTLTVLAEKAIDLDHETVR